MRTVWRLERFLVKHRLVVVLQVFDVVIVATQENRPLLTAGERRTHRAILIAGCMAQHDVKGNVFRVNAELFERSVSVGIRRPALEAVVHVF